jgi:hypothetical protein
MSDVPEISGMRDVGCVGAQLHESDAIQKHSYGLRLRQGKRQVAMKQRQTREKSRR